MKRIVFAWLLVLAFAGVLSAQSAPKIGTCRTSSGSGTPEGAKSGSVCDTYWRTDNGTIWIKQSGTNTTTGWTQLIGGGGGTVTSVSLTLPGIFSVSGTPVTTSGTIAGSLIAQAANRVWAGPTTGASAAPTFRALVLDDLPSITSAKITDGTISFADLAQNSAVTGDVPTWDGASWVADAPPGSSGGAPLGAQYLTLATDATLTNERVLTCGTGVSCTDAGAGSTLTLANTGYVPGGTDVAVADGGTGLSAIGDDKVPVGSGATTYVATTLPSCSNATTSKLLYDTSTNTFSCGTDQNTVATCPAGEATLVSSGTSLSVDLSLKQQYPITLTGNVTLTLTNPTAGCSSIFVFVQGAGPYTVTWPSNVTWENGTAPTITTVNGDYVFCHLRYTLLGGDGYLGFCTTNPIPPL